MHGQGEPVESIEDKGELTMRNRLIVAQLGGLATILLLNPAVNAQGAKKPALAADVTKTGGIEPPAKALVAYKSAAVRDAAGDFHNPKVQPGLVHWHATFADACAAARKSGKPVLLFQMMGKLDEQFC
jgi:hypothetical protein